MRSLVVIATLGAAGFLWTGVGAQVYRQPDAGTGLVTVAGAVEITNTPSVMATQAGQWKVELANTPSVTLPPPDFLRARTKYEVVWPNGDKESVVADQIGRDGWVRVDDNRWINVAGARSLEAKP